jgi:hypothetical protein
MVKAPGPGPVLPGGVSAQLEIIKARTTTTGARIDERRTVPSQVYLDSEWTQTQSM